MCINIHPYAHSHTTHTCIFHIVHIRKHTIITHTCTQYTCRQILRAIHVHTCKHVSRTLTQHTYVHTETLNTYVHTTFMYLHIHSKRSRLRVLKWKGIKSLEDQHGRVFKLCDRFLQLQGGTSTSLTKVCPFNASIQHPGVQSLSPMAVPLKGASWGLFIWLLPDPESLSFLGFPSWIRTIVFLTTHTNTSQVSAVTTAYFSFWLVLYLPSDRTVSLVTLTAAWSVLRVPWQVGNRRMLCLLSESIFSPRTCYCGLLPSIWKVI